MSTPRSIAATAARTIVRLTAGLLLGVALLVGVIHSLGAPDTAERAVATVQTAATWDELPAVARALAAWELEHGTLPASLDDMVAQGLVTTPTLARALERKGWHWTVDRASCTLRSPPHAPPTPCGADCIRVGTR
jgi:competence protein ComGC